MKLKIIVVLLVILFIGSVFMLYQNNRTPTGIGRVVFNGSENPNEYFNENESDYRVVTTNKYGTLYVGHKQIITAGE